MKQIFNVLFCLLLTPISSKFYTLGDRNSYIFSSAFMKGSFVNDCADSAIVQTMDAKTTSCLLESKKGKLDQIYDFLIDTNTTSSTNSIVTDNSAFEMCLFPSAGVFFEKSSLKLSKEVMIPKVKSLLKNKLDNSLAASMLYTSTGICFTAVVSNSCFKYAENLGLIFELSDMDVANGIRNLEFSINNVPFLPFSVVSNKFYNFKGIDSSNLEKVTLNVCSREFFSSKSRTFTISMTENLNTFSASYFTVAFNPYKPIITHNFFVSGTSERFISFDIPFLIGKNSDALAVINFDDEYKIKYKSLLPLITVRATIDLVTKGTTCRRMTLDTKYILDSAFCQEVINRKRIFLFFTNLPAYTRFPFSSVKITDLVTLIDLADSNVFVPI